MKAESQSGLRATYPCVAQLVGASLFDHLGLLFERSAYATRGDEALGQFLTSVPELRRLPYLPDVARLEWAVRECGRAAPPLPLDMADLAEFGPEQLGNGRFICHPALFICRSHYPLFQIWERCQQGQPGQAALEPPETVLVARDHDGARVERLGRGEAALLAAIHEGRSFAESCRAALNDDPGFDVASVIARCAQCGILSGFEPHPAGTG